MPTPPYAPQTWANGSGGGTPLAARRLNPIETGIKNATDGVIALETDVATLSTAAGLIQTGTGAPGIGTPTFPAIYLDDSVTPVVTWIFNPDTSLWDEVVSDLFQIASGAPSGLTPTFPKFYIDNSATPWQLYAYDGAAWHLIGDGGGTTIQFGAGTPGVTSPPTTPILYADTTTTPYDIYVYHSAAWHLTGDGGGVPIQFGAGTPGVTTPPTTPILYADTTTSPFEIYVYQSGAWHLTGDGSGGGGSVQFGVGTPAVTTPTSPPAIYIDNTTVPQTPYAWDGAAWKLLRDGVLGTGASSYMLTSLHGTYDPSINSGGVAQDTLTGGVAYTVDFPNTALYVSDNAAGQDFQITDAHGANITGLVFQALSSCVVRIDEFLTVYGLAQGDSVYVSTWNQSFVQADSSAVLICRHTLSENQDAGNQVSLDSYIGTPLVPQISFILDTAATTVGVDAQVICRVQVGVVDTDGPGRRAATPTGLAGNVSVAGQVTLSWTPGVGGGTVFDYKVQDLTSGLFYTATASPLVISGLAAGARTFSVEARSDYGYSSQVNGTYTIT